ncbi:hypothetical protein CYMTET_52030 [Cymbomonas tetramitiformis]|uniref:MsrB domain-containing protein n=1 Tax=Cymbomonas tetramitiformis TaxID=36881 RepID=A0AAE0BJT7_9CHLO|nr:hypothetical protein CYMTET_52030 [Cymbomonas tetramitiformis]
MAMAAVVLIALILCTVGGAFFLDVFELLFTIAVALVVFVGLAYAWFSIMRNRDNKAESVKLNSLPAEESSKERPLQTVHPAWDKASGDFETGSPGPCEIPAAAQVRGAGDKESEHGCVGVPTHALPLAAPLSGSPLRNQVHSVSIECHEGLEPSSEAALETAETSVPQGPCPKAARQAWEEVPVPGVSGLVLGTVGDDAMVARGGEGEHSESKLYHGSNFLAAAAPASVVADSPHASPVPTEDETKKSRRTLTHILCRPPGGIEEDEQNHPHVEIAQPPPADVLEPQEQPKDQHLMLARSKTEKVEQGDDIGLVQLTSMESDGSERPFFVEAKEECPSCEDPVALNSEEEDCPSCKDPATRSATAEEEECQTCADLAAPSVSHAQEECLSCEDLTGPRITADEEECQSCADLADERECQSCADLAQVETADHAWWDSLSAQARSEEEDWQRKLSALQFRVLRQKGTEEIHTGEYCTTNARGVYSCSGCGQDLYLSAHKFPAAASTHGWPAFFDEIRGAITREKNKKVPEIVCSRCGGHLGHVFKSSRYPGPRKERHCVNSVSLLFKEESNKKSNVRSLM